MGWVKKVAERRGVPFSDLVTFFLVELMEIHGQPHTEAKKEIVRVMLGLYDFTPEKIHNRDLRTEAEKDFAWDMDRIAVDEMRPLFPNVIAAHAWRSWYSQVLVTYDQACELPPSRRGEKLDKLITLLETGHPDRIRENTIADREAREFNLFLISKARSLLPVNLPVPART